MSNAAKITFSEIWASTLGVCARHFGVIAGYVLIFGILDLLAQVFGGSIVESSIPALLSVFATYFLLEHLLVREGLTQNLRPARNLLSYLGISLLAGLGIMLGLVFLIVPGLILKARWSIAFGIVIVDDTAGATQAMQDSWDATANSQGAITGFFAIYFLLIVGFGVLSALVFGWEASSVTLNSEWPDLIGSFVEMCVNQAGYAFSTAAIVALMLLLRQSHEGFQDVFA